MYLDHYNELLDSKSEPNKDINCYLSYNYVEALYSGQRMDVMEKLLIK